MSTDYFIEKTYYKSIKDVPRKFWPEPKYDPVSGRQIYQEESPQFFAHILQEANSIRINEEREKFEAKRREKELQIMAEMHQNQIQISNINNGDQAF